MKLLETSTLKLYTFHEPNLPEYAILSHRWFSDEQEVTFQELQSLTDTLQCQCGKEGRDQRVRRKKGFDKIASFCRLAEEDGFQYAWIDTCCIDKSSSSELSETINSMYKWYSSSRVCYFYMVDVPRVDYSSDEPLILFKASEWFRRGWTLQELLAPQQHKYLAQDWSLIGVTLRNPTSDNGVSLDGDGCHCSTAFPGAKCLETEVSEASGIRIDRLRSFDPRWTRYTTVCIAERMSWAAKRETSRLEDTAYCLLGIFDIHMTLMYGEGEKAFIRLQEEIIRHSVDRTILAWDRTGHESLDQLLAPSPQYFKFVDFVFKYKPPTADEVHEITSQGLLTHMEVADHPTRNDVLLARLDDSHAFSQSGMPKHQILLLLPIVWHLHPFYPWISWMSTRGGETHVYCPYELAVVNRASVKRRLRSFKRRKLRIARWHVDHGGMDHQHVSELLIEHVSLTGHSSPMSTPQPSI
ncbi:hypothetical protein PV08_00905 [Exophiala spinifera]|uniref:Uncharacterized protein n=1 Tax=Exophiala spinifera TaxID=91928 RepID=A0A0D2BP78_9EURO|nr:uncharacterized protein PV08_00905 [Exophiala spinifera]KIW20330.1 hypothetical protein PV08_00905 [Exophiala spinifera]